MTPRGRGSCEEGCTCCRVLWQAFARVPLQPGVVLEGWKPCAGEVLVAGAAGLALCQGMRWSLPSGSTQQLQRELKNAVCLEFFAWLITRDPAAKILCQGRCGGAQKVLLSRAKEPICGCFPALHKLVLLIPFCPFMCSHTSLEKGTGGVLTSGVSLSDFFEA